MEKGTTYVALDDSKRKIVAGILRPGAPAPEFGEPPNDPPHIQRLFERLKREGPVAACYEAGVSGYDLYRQITGLGVSCQVMAPALTPRRPGQRIKTDRRDAGKLVHLFRAGELTPIHVPDEAEEAGRDLVRCRDDVRRDVLRWRHRLLKLLDRHGRLSGGQELEPGSLDLDPRSALRPAGAAAGLRGLALCARASARPPRRAGQRGRSPCGDRAVPRPGRLAAVLPRDRHPVGHDPPGRGGGLPAVRASAATHGLSRVGAQ